MLCGFGRGRGVKPPTHPLVAPLHSIPTAFFRTTVLPNTTVMKRDYSNTNLITFDDIFGYCVGRARIA